MEIAVKNIRDHPDFNKLYSYFISYVSRQRSNEVIGATSKPDIERCRAEYADILLQGSISLARKTVSAVVNKFIQIRGAQIMNGVEEAARSRAYRSCQVWIKGGDMTCAEEWPLTQTGIHLKLYKFIEKQFDDSLPMSKAAEKTYLAMSGIVNTRMDHAHQVFGKEPCQIRALCLWPSISHPNQKLREALVPLQDAYRLGGLEELLNEVEERLSVEAKARRERSPRDPLKGRILDIARHIVIKKSSKIMDEAGLVEVWSYITNVLAGHELTLLR
ncbi:hypothetical protein BGW38_001995 [Lunasporangiospora selenospora]|uniref:Uncharacterized protein n=1 Tax=Lunasporangiospora selenospora TaxID=979761 RepID=A0A9P6KDR6_9FUNG|nr:hypothetical protein BGW38_001995 [Lunasporangiospora selenospora]